MQYICEVYKAFGVQTEWKCQKLWANVRNAFLFCISDIKQTGYSKEHF